MTPEERIKALEDEVESLKEFIYGVPEVPAAARPSWEDTHRAFVPDARRMAGEG